MYNFNSKKRSEINGYLNLNRAGVSKRIVLYRRVYDQKATKYCIRIGIKFYAFIKLRWVSMTNRLDLHQYNQNNDSGI